MGRDLEMLIWSFYIGGEIWRKLFGAVIFKKRYYKEWRDLFKAVILAEGYNIGWERSGESCLELLY